MSEPRVDLKEIYNRLSEFPCLKQCLSTSQKSAERWLANDYTSKPIEKWSLITGWLSTVSKDWTGLYRRYVIGLENALAFLHTANSSLFPQIAAKLRNHATDRANTKGILAEIGLHVFLTAHGIDFELEKQINGATDVDICAFPTSANPLFLEVQYVTESDANMRIAEISAAYGGLPTSIPFEQDKYRIKTIVHQKVRKFTTNHITFVALDCSDIPHHGSGGSVYSIVAEAFLEAVRGFDINDKPTGYFDHSIDKEIRSLVEGIIWFSTNYENRLNPVERGLVINPHSHWKNEQCIKDFHTLWSK